MKAKKEKLYQENTNNKLVQLYLSDKQLPRIKRLCERKNLSRKYDSSKLVCTK